MVIMLVKVIHVPLYFAGDTKIASRIKCVSQTNLVSFPDGIEPMDFAFHEEDLAVSR